MAIPNFDHGARDLVTVSDVANSPAPTTTTRFGDIIKTLAGALADIAVSQGLGYPNKPAMVAVPGTKVGQLAYVDASDPDGGTYMWDGSAYQPFMGAVEKSLQVIDARVPEGALPGYVFNVWNLLQKAAFGVMANGDTQIARLVLPLQLDNGAALGNHLPDGYKWGVGDKIGWTTLIDDAGVLCADTIRVNNIEGWSPPTPVDPVFKPKYLAENVNHIYTYGQSLSMGHAGSPLLTTVAPPNSYMFTGSGVRTNDSATPYGSFSPLVSSISPINSARQETPAGGLAVSFQERLSAENPEYVSYPFNLLLSADGDGGQTIAQLSKGTANYDRLIASVQAGKDIANADGDTYQASAITWTQGESDYNVSTTYDTYMSRMRTLFSEFQADAKAITGQKGDIAIFMYQIGSHLSTLGAAPDIAHNLANAHRDICQELPNAYLVTPTYHLQYKLDTDVHMPATSYKIMGAYYGLAYKRVVVDGVDWKPCDRTEITRQGNVLLVHLHVPNGPLTIDTTLVPENTNFGFKLFDGASEIAITSVSINSPNSVKIVAAATVPAGAELRYAMDSDIGPYNGIPSGARGNIRDSQGDEIIFEPAGMNVPMHNWLLMFSEIID